MQRPASLFLIFASLLAQVAVFPVHAVLVNGVQGSFQSRSYNGGRNFSYTYATPSGQVRSLAFRLNEDDIARGSAEFRRIDEAEARAFAFAAMQRKAAELENPDFHLVLTQQEGSIAVAASGSGASAPTPELMRGLENQLTETYESARLTYIRNHLYRVVSTQGTTDVIGPDYAAVARRYTAAMVPVAKALKTAMSDNSPPLTADPRAFINEALVWLQTIPYNDLKDRQKTNGAGFQTPYGLLLGNLGDCDTKTTALAALIRAEYPSIPLTIITVPRHAFLGIGLPQGPNDYALRTAHGTFILADPTGPALSPLGLIDSQTQAHLRTNQIEILPIR